MHPHVSIIIIIIIIVSPSSRIIISIIVSPSSCAHHHHTHVSITIINIMVGVVVGSGLWLIGIPTAFVWGVAATVLNFLPYVGALISIVLVGIISITTFDNLGYGLIAPAFILLVHIAEGQFLTPLLLGRRLELNAVAVFISISFWSWLWGFVGALMAVPLLVVIKVICDNFESLQPFGNFLSAQQPISRDDGNGEGS